MEGENLNGSDSEHNEKDGDRVFKAASKLVDELKRGELAAKLKGLKSAKLEDLDLPPIVEQTMMLASRKLKAKLVDLKEFASELKDLAKHKTGDISDRVAHNFDLPTKDDLERLERRIQELERENESLRSAAKIPSRKASGAKKRVSGSGSAAKRATKSRE